MCVNVAAGATWMSYVGDAYFHGETLLLRAALHSTDRYNLGTTWLSQEHRLMVSDVVVMTPRLLPVFVHALYATSVATLENIYSVYNILLYLAYDGCDVMLSDVALIALT